jgi:uncharacterized iron-regulated membrane protein
MTSQPRPLSDLIGSLIGPIVWAAHFFVMYGAEALICINGGPGLSNMHLFAAGATAIAVGILLAAIMWNRRSRHPHDRAPALRNVSNILSLISIGAIAATALPAAVVPTCMNPGG